MTFFHWMLSASAESARESFALPIQASSLAEGVDETFAFVYWCSVVFFIALMGAMFYFVVAYKKKSDDDRTLDLKGHHTLEIVWSVFPSFLLIAMFVMGFQNYIKSTVPPVNSIQVNVTGQKWVWNYAYPGLGNIESSDLVVPKQTPVRLQMVSKDVLHSFFVPDFRIKKDVVPNRYTNQWFDAIDIFPVREDDKVYTKVNAELTDAEPLEGSKQLVFSRGANIQEAVAKQCAKDKKSDPSLTCTTEASQVKIGQHQVFCTEYCGDDHSRMLSRVIVLEEADFQAWVRSKREFVPEEKYTDAVSLGAYYASKAGCVGCHSVDGSPGTGPSWKGDNYWGAQREFADGTSRTVDEAYITDSIMNPDLNVVKGFNKGIMSAGLQNSFGKDKADDGIKAIINYIKAINGVEVTAGGATAKDPKEEAMALGAKFAGKAGCVACHSVDGSVLIGPSWKGIWGTERKFTDGSTQTVDANYIRESILEPHKKLVEGFGPLMAPGLNKAWGEEEEAGISAIIEYIKALE